MKKLRTKLTVLTVVISLVFATVGMAEARNNHNNHYKQYSQNYNPHHYNNFQHKPCYKRVVKNNYRFYNHNKRRPPVKYVRPHRVKYVKPRRHHNRYLYPVLIGAGVGLLVLGLTR